MSAFNLHQAVMDLLRIEVEARMVNDERAYVLDFVDPHPVVSKSSRKIWTRRMEAQRQAEWREADHASLALRLGTAIGRETVIAHAVDRLYERYMLLALNTSAADLAVGVPKDLAKWIAKQLKRADEAGEAANEARLYCWLVWRDTTTWTSHLGAKRADEGQYESERRAEDTRWLDHFRPVQEDEYDGLPSLKTIPNDKADDQQSYVGRRVRVDG